MKVKEILEKDSNKKVTYAGVRFSAFTKSAIMAYIKDNKIPNPIGIDALHSTVLYSKKFLPNYESTGKYAKPLVGKPTKFEKWPSLSDDKNGARCLVLKYDCSELIDRHNKLMEEHDATFDFPEYKPHITFSYDVAGFKDKDLPKFKDDIEIIEEYQKELTLD